MLEDMTGDTNIPLTKWNKKRSDRKYADTACHRGRQSERDGEGVDLLYTAHCSVDEILHSQS